MLSSYSQPLAFIVNSKQVPGDPKTPGPAHMQTEKTLNYFILLTSTRSFLKGHSIFYRVILPSTQKKILFKLSCLVYVFWFKLFFILLAIN